MEQADLRAELERVIEQRNELAMVLDFVSVTGHLHAEYHEDADGPYCAAADPFPIDMVRGAVLQLLDVEGSADVTRDGRPVISLQDSAGRLIAEASPAEFARWKAEQTFEEVQV